MKKQIKLVHVGQLIGGVHTSVDLIVSHLDSEKIQNVIICGENDLKVPIYSKRGTAVEVHKIKLKRPVSFADLLAFFQLAMRLYRLKPDLVHCHSAKGGFLGRIVCRLLNIDCIYTPQAFSYLSASSAIQRKIFIWLERLARGKSYLLACSESEATNGREVVRYSSRRIRIWNNSISPIDGVINGLENPYGHLFPYFCTIGRPSYQKNSFELVNYFGILKKQIADVKLLIVGVGFYSPLKAKLLEYIKSKNLEGDIYLVDWIERKVALKIVSEAFCYLTLAKYEGLPYAILEALSLGVPVIASDADGNRDCIVNGYNGYIVDLKNLEESIPRVINIKDENLRNKLKQNARISYEKTFDIRYNIRELEKLYFEILN